MKTLLIITNYRGMSPFIESFVGHLCDLLSVVYVLDTDGYCLYEGNQLIKRNPILSNISSIKIPFFRKYILKIITKILLKQAPKTSNVLIFALQQQLIEMGEVISSKGSRIDLIYSGSDFYRSEASVKQKAKSILNICDSIVLTSEQHKNDFNKFYNYEFDHKVRYAGLGLDNLKIIDAIINENSKNELKNSFKLNETKIIITVGYNGIEAQQHIQIINQLRKLDLSNVIVVFPITYGLKSEYKKLLIESLKGVSFEYKIFDEYLTNEETCQLRVISDIVLNYQISDAASRSLLEHIYTNAIMLVGDWLPYGFWKDMGVYYHTSNFEELSLRLKFILQNFSSEKEKCKKNRQIVKENWSWENKMKDWRKIFNICK